MKVSTGGNDHHALPVRLHGSPKISNAEAGMPINWRAIERRALSAGFFTFFLGPPVGGFMFGLIGGVNHIALSVGGHLPGPPTTFGDELFFLFIWPIGTALLSFLVGWPLAAMAAVYVAARVGIIPDFKGHDS
jgi:hypothetical protein